jgi:hypothetical protein
MQFLVSHSRLEDSRRLWLKRYSSGMVARPAHTSTAYAVRRWSGRRESNPPSWLGKPEHYHYATPAETKTRLSSYNQLKLLNFRTAWKAVILPLNDARKCLWHRYLSHEPQGRWPPFSRQPRRLSTGQGHGHQQLQCATAQPGPSRTAGDAAACSCRQRKFRRVEHAIETSNRGPGRAARLSFAMCSESPSGRCRDCRVESRERHCTTAATLAGLAG